MKIAISARGASLDASFDPRFGRAAYLVIVNDATEEVQGFANPAGNAGGGAGVQAAQFVAGQGARVVISGDFGPNAFEALSAAGIEMVLAQGEEHSSANASLSVRDLLERYRQGQLQTASTASRGAGRRARRRGR